MNIKLCSVFILLCFSIFAQDYGIDSRVENKVILIDELPIEDPGKMQLESIFTSTWFESPVFLTDAQDNSGRIFVVEKGGRIRIVSKNDVTTEAVTFLDIKDRVRNSGEQGLLSMAFAPKYQENGHIYVYYSWNRFNPATSRISRFTNQNPQGNYIDPASEEVILEIPQPYSNHNGGMIAFGPDGMLYIGLGDGGSGGDPLNSGQDTTTLLGNILRIDVEGTPDKGRKYRIPGDNPFYAKGPAGELSAKEIYAYGLRNPWRFSFDRVHHYLFAGDVGQNKIEEIDIVVSGGNYGWRIMEGDNCFKSTNCNSKGLIKPIATYDREFGYSITGGYVYYGNRVPSLHGMYIYGDYGSGNIWGLRYDGTTVEGPYMLVRSSGVNITSFGQDEDGEVYVLGHGGGVYQFATQRGNGFPLRLSEIPALLASGKGEDQTHLGIIPYEPVSQLWTDGMYKTRYMAIPGLDKVSFHNDGGWDFPENSVVIKNFAIATDETNPQSQKMVETRLMYRKNDKWHGFSYEWNEEGTDAVLLTGSKVKNFIINDKNGQQVTIEHLFPSRSQCIQCHTNQSNGLLGISTNQLNSPFEYPKSGIVDNQVRTLEHIQLFNNSLPKNMPQMVDPKDKSVPIGERARAYLAANCAMCHQENGTAPTNLDFRWGIEESKMNAINIKPQNDLGIPDARIIYPGQPEKSILLERIHSRGEHKMPPIGSSRIDEEAVSIIRQWIESLK